MELGKGPKLLARQGGLQKTFAPPGLDSGPPGLRAWNGGLPQPVARRKRAPRLRGRVPWKGRKGPRHGPLFSACSPFALLEGACQYGWGHPPPAAKSPRPVPWLGRLHRGARLPAAFPRHREPVHPSRKKAFPHRLACATPNNPLANPLRKQGLPDHRRAQTGPAAAKCFGRRFVFHRPCVHLASDCFCKNHSKSCTPYPWFPMGNAHSRRGRKGDTPAITIRKSK